MVNVETHLTVLLIGFLISSLATGSDAISTVASAPDFVEQCRVIRQEAERKLASIYEKVESEYDPTTDRPDQNGLIKDARAQSEIILSSATEQVFVLVKPHAAESAAAESLAWVATTRGANETGRSGLELLTQHHLVHAQTIKVVTSLSRNGNPSAKSLLRAQLSSADLPQELTWRVMLSFARLLQSEAALSSRLSFATDEELAPFISNQGKERVAELKGTDATALEEVAISLFGEINRK